MSTVKTWSFATDGLAGLRSRKTIRCRVAVGDGVAVSVSVATGVVVDVAVGVGVRVWVVVAVSPTIVTLPFSTSVRTEPPA